MPNEECTFTNLVTTPTAAPQLVLTVRGIKEDDRIQTDTDMCAVNPHGKTHGAPSDEIRHVGDLGNFKTDSQGNGKGSISDSHIKLIGEQSVLGVRGAVHTSCSTS